MTILYIIIALLILLLMILIHEFGHYIVGKILKFKINEFSIGFGPKIFSKTNKKTGEIFSLRLLPLGGFCAFDGEDSVDDESNPVQNDDSAKKNHSINENVDVFDEETNRADIIEENHSLANVEKDDNQQEGGETELKKFNDQPPWKRILVLLAGATFNFLSGIIFAFIFLCVGGNMFTVVGDKVLTKDGEDINPQLMKNDVIIRVNGVDLNVMNTFSDVVSASDGTEFTFTVIRDGETLDVIVKKGTVYDKKNKKEYLGFGIMSGTLAKPMNVWEALALCVPYTLKLSWVILGTFGKLLTGKLGLNTVTGPISTIGFMAQAAKQNWLNILLLLPMISANLAIFNVLPIPALDGSKVVFAIIEWVRGKPLNRKVEAYIHAAGFIVLLGFCVLVEILHLF